MSVDSIKLVGRFSVLSILILLIILCSLASAANIRHEGARTVEQIYIKQLSQCYEKLIKKEKMGCCQYFLFDINCDSLPELFVKTGTCEANFMISVYALKNKRMKKVFETEAGHSEFLKGKNYIIRVMVQSGSCFCDRITFENNQIKETTIFSGNCFGFDADSDFPEYNEQGIVFYDYDNTEPIIDSLKKTMIPVI